MKYIHALILIMTASTIFAESTPVIFKTKGIKSARLSTPSGNISLSSTDDDETTLTITKTEWSNRCSLKHSQTTSNISVSVEASKSGAEEDEPLCHADILLALPKVTKITATVGRGNIGINDIKGSMILKIGEGSIGISQTEIPQLIADIGHGNLIVEGKITRSDIHIGYGDVRIAGMLASGDIKIGAGAIDVTYGHRPAPGVLNLKIGKGDATLSLPSQTSLNANIYSGLGHIHSEIPNQITGSFHVNMRSGLGNLFIKKR